MPTETLTRAWTDVEFRASLTADQRDLLPAHPAGDLDAELRQLVGQEACHETTFCTDWSAGAVCCC